MKPGPDGRLPFGDGNVAGIEQLIGLPLLPAKLSDLAYPASLAPCEFARLGFRLQASPLPQARFVHGEIPPGWTKRPAGLQNAFYVHDELGRARAMVHFDSGHPLAAGPEPSMHLLSVEAYVAHAVDARAPLIADPLWAVPARLRRAIEGRIAALREDLVRHDALVPTDDDRRSTVDMGFEGQRARIARYAAALDGLPDSADMPVPTFHNEGRTGRWHCLDFGLGLTHTPYLPTIDSPGPNPAKATGLSAAQRREASAYHEAGHAVVGLAHALSVTEALLHDQDISHAERSPAHAELGAGESGTTRIDPSGPLSVLHLIHFYVAGVRAARRYLLQAGLLTPAAAFVEDAFGGISDKQKVAATATAAQVHLTYGTGRPPDLAPHAAHFDLADAYNFVDSLLTARWPHVRAVAHHLLTHGRADADDLAALAPSQEAEGS